MTDHQDEQSRQESTESEAAIAPPKFLAPALVPEQNPEEIPEPEQPPETKHYSSRLSALIFGGWLKRKK